MKVKQRVKRKKVANKSLADETADNIISVTYSSEVLGIVTKMYEFKNPCDFQYLPLKKEMETNPIPTSNVSTSQSFSCASSSSSQLSDPATTQLTEQNSSSKPEISSDGSYLETVPFIFCPSHFKPLTAPLFTEKAKVGAADKVDGPVAKRKVKVTVKSVKFGESIPLTSDFEPFSHDLSRLRRNPIKFKDMYDFLCHLFEEHPVWSKKQFDDLPQLAGKAYVLYECLPFIAYCFISGILFNVTIIAVSTASTITIMCLTNGCLSLLIASS